MVNKIRFLVVLLFVFAHPGWAEEPAVNERWVEVTGKARLTAGEVVARRSALLAAYRQAVNLGGSVEISEFSQIRNFKEVTDIVTKRSRGVIRQYEVINEGADPDNKDTFQITIKALVADKTGDGSGKDQELSQFVSLIGEPRVLFIIGEPDSGEVTTAEQTMAAMFREVGYQVMTLDSIDVSGIGPAILTQARDGSAQMAARIGKAAGADIVVVGKLQFELSEMSGGTDVKGKLGVAQLAVKAIMPGNARILHVTNHQERFLSLQGASGLAARQKSISGAAQSAAIELKWKVPEILSREPRVIDIQVSKVSYQNADKIRKALQKMEGIEKVELSGWQNNIASLTVRNVFTGPRESDLANALLSRFKKLRVMSVGQYAIELAW